MSKAKMADTIKQVKMVMVFKKRWWEFDRMMPSTLRKNQCLIRFLMFRTFIMMLGLEGLILFPWEGSKRVLV